MDPTALTISSALELLRSGDLTPSGLAEACSRKIERLNPTINAFATVTANETKQSPTVQEIASSSALAMTPLANIPLAVKDLIDVAGLPTVAGSPKFFGHQPVLKDAAVVEKLKNAGALILGKTNTHEIALGITGINPHTGPVRNPHDTSRITGGSSSGSAAAVASGMVPGALGSDTGGSIRIPASLCGVVGLKPTYGRVSTRGVVPLSWNMDHIGSITRSVRDAGLLLQVMAGYDPQDPASVNCPADDYLHDIEDGIKGWHVAMAIGDFIDECDPGVYPAFENAAKVFTDLGAQVEKVEVAILRDAAAANGTMVIADAAAFHRERLSEHPDWFGADVRQRLEWGRAVTSTEYSLARRVQAEAKRYFDLLFEKFDVLILPSTAAVAAPIEGLDSAAYASNLTRFTAPFNLTGSPALSVPNGLVDGLPIGLQIVGGPWQEGKVLAAGKAFEESQEN
jgi:aspartyl-tRNA(Asn)/glutamyl-tRNA(Gln) amidotransferase subunit A